jgi:hypothetical protein
MADILLDVVPEGLKFAPADRDIRGRRKADGDFVVLRFKHSNLYRRIDDDAFVHLPCQYEHNETPFMRGKDRHEWQSVNVPNMTGGISR